MKFEFLKERLEPLTLQHIRDSGWEEKDLDKINDKRVFFEKGNYFLSVLGFKDKEDAVLQFFPKDPSIIDWVPDPENMRIYIKCPSKDHFDIITSLL